MQRRETTPGVWRVVVKPHRVPLGREQRSGYTRYLRCGKLPVLVDQKRCGPKKVCLTGVVFDLFFSLRELELSPELVKISHIFLHNSVGGAAGGLCYAPSFIV